MPVTLHSERNYKVNWSAFILVFFVASTKFLFAPSLSIIYFTFWETILFVTIGGIAGVTAFYFGAELIMKFNHNRRIKKAEKLKKEGKYIPPKIFNPFRRRVIKIKNSFGLLGIALVTPCIISIPIGSVLAARFFHHRKETIFILYLFVIVWAFILTLGNDFVASLIR